MENNEVEPSGLKKFWKAINHPLLAVILIPLLFGIIFLLLGNKENKPRYSVSPSTLIAEQTDNAPELRLFWDETEIIDISSVEIKFWNGGKDYIDRSRISATDKIKIIIPDGINVLSFSIISRSRNELDFTLSQIENQNGTNYIEINIVGDEALEKSDGARIKILYSGTSSNKFVIQGRIKGSKSGFKEIPWATDESSVKTTFFPITMSIILFIAMFTILTRKLKIWPHKEPTRDMLPALIMPIIAALIGVITGLIISPGSFLSLFVPKW